jgi:hypothetical protein
MKKLICIIAASLILTILASGILSGCEANNAASAANAGKNTAKKLENTVAKLEVMNDSDFGFPAVFGNEFFTEEQEILRPTAPVSRRVNQRNYRAKHFGDRKLNQDGSARTKYLDQVDDLYVLCADISAANAQCNEKVAEIKEEIKKLEELSNEIKKSGKKGKYAFAKFNYNNKMLNESVTKLYRDRNRIRSAAKNNDKQRGNAFDVETATMHNLKIVDKLEVRLKLLDDTHEKLVAMNETMRVTLGKPTLKQSEPDDSDEFVGGEPKNASRFITLPYKIAG